MDRKKQWILIDNLKRKFFLKHEIKKILLKSLIKNSNLKISYKYYAMFQKNKINKHFSLIQQNNRCISTGRIWSVLRFFKYSRFYLRTQSYTGNLPGFKRASW